MDTYIIWFIDEDEHQRRTYERELKDMMQQSVQVKAIPPYRQKEDYLPLLDNPSTACIIIDQKLKDTGIATYTGIELAQYLRGINKKIPIYILTNYKDEHTAFASGEWSVEDIIGKDELSQEDKSTIVAARILRRIDVYEDILGEREKRFNNLLRKSLNDDLGEEERKELEELQLERSSATLASELEQLEGLEKVLGKYEKLLDLLK